MPLTHGRLRRGLLRGVGLAKSLCCPTPGVDVHVDALNPQVNTSIAQYLRQVIFAPALANHPATARLFLLGG